MYARCLRYFSSRTPRTRRVMSGSIFLAVAALMSASIFATGPEATPEPRSEKAWPVSLMTVTPSAAKPSLRVYGRVESSRIAHLRTNLVAEVAEVHVREGDWVEAGALLITLNDRELKLRLIEQRAELTRLEAELDSLRIERASMESSTSQHQSMRAVAQNRQKGQRVIVPANDDWRRQGKCLRTDACIRRLEGRANVDVNLACEQLVLKLVPALRT